MDTFKAIESRRAVKHFDPDHRLSDLELRQLMNAALQSPTSFNMQNWRFVLLQDKDKRKALRSIAWDQAQITDASLCIILCADKQAHAKEPKRYWRNAPDDVRDMLSSMLFGFYEGKESLQIDEGHRSCGIAGQTIMLAAKAMGYDSCPMVGFDFDKAAEIINLPQHCMISYIIVIGKTLQPARERGGSIPYDEAVIIDSFPV